jgi:putative spermidine/putrescine transport system permease protein
VLDEPIRNVAGNRQGRGAPLLSRLRSGWNAPFLLALPALAFAAVFALWPMLAFVRDSFLEGGTVTLLQYQRLWHSASFASVLGRTLTTAISVTLLCIVVAYPLAYALTKVRGSRKTMLIGLVVLPYLTSVIVRTYAWAAILAVQGPVNKALTALGIVSKPLLLGHSDFGTYIGMVHILLPIAVLTIWSALEKIDPIHWTAAASLGASRIEAFLTVYLPQSLPSILSAASLVYILALGAYVIPQTLGSTRGLLFAQLVAEQATALLNWNLAGAMAVVMLVAAGLPAALLLLLRHLGGIAGRGRAIGTWQSFFSRSIQPLLDRVPGAFWTFGWKSFATLALAFLLIPELIVIAFSFGPEQQITFPPAYFTLDGYAHTLSDPVWMDPLRRSVVFAFVDALAAVFLGSLAAYGFARSRPFYAAVGTILLVVPVVLPEIVIAISYFIFASRIDIAGTALGIVIGQGVAAVGLVTIIMSAIVRQLDPNLELAAQMCGAGRTRMLREIVLPLIAPGLIVGFIYGFLHAFDNLVLPLFIAGTQLTVTVRMFLSLQQELTSAPAVVASILIAVLVAGLATAILLARKTSMRLPFIGG